MPTPLGQAEIESDDQTVTLQKIIREFTLIRSAATFSRQEKESNVTRLAKRRGWRDSLSQRERAGERESAENYNEM